MEEGCRDTPALSQMGYYCETYIREKYIRSRCTNVTAVEWKVTLTNREGKIFQKQAVTTVNLKGGKAVLVRRGFVQPAFF